MSDSKVENRTSTEDSTKGDKYSEHSSKVAKSSELSNTNVSRNGASVSATTNQDHNVSEHSLRKTVSENTGGQNVESKDITPQKAEGQTGSSTTPGKPKSKRRLAANFNFGNATP